MLTEGLETTRCTDYRGISFLCVYMRPQGWPVVVLVVENASEGADPASESRPALGAFPGKGSEL